MVFSWNFSDSSSSSEQYAEAILTQQYSGTCSVLCNNSMSDVNITFINDRIGGNVSISQTCSANGQCLFNNFSDAYSDVLFTAKNSSNASGATAALSVASVNINTSKVNSLIEIQQIVNQAQTQACSVSSVNTMNNINLFAANTDISGGVAIAQGGVTNGNCQLNSSMTAAVYATGTIDNCSSSGKILSKKCSAGKGGSSWGTIIIAIVVSVIFVALAMMVAKVIKDRSTSSAPTTATHDVVSVPTASGSQSLQTVQIGQPVDVVSIGQPSYTPQQVGGPKIINVYPTYTSQKV